MRRLLACLPLLALAACGLVLNRRDHSRSPAHEPSNPSASSAGSSLPNLGPLTEQARRDLSRRTGLALDRVVVEQVRQFTWSDASLGCPEPGKEYAMAMISGYIITLRAGGSLYNYHTDRNDRVLLCPRRAPY